MRIGISGLCGLIGALNALGHGIGVVLVSPEKQCLPFMARLCFDCTNNMAEYEACTLRI